MSIQRVTKNAVFSLLDNPLRTTNASEYVTWKGRQAILEVVVAGNKSQADARAFKYSLLGPRPRPRPHPSYVATRPGLGLQAYCCAFRHSPAEERRLTAHVVLHADFGEGVATVMSGKRI